MSACARVHCKLREWVYLMMVEAVVVLVWKASIFTWWKLKEEEFGDDDNYLSSFEKYGMVPADFYSLLCYKLKKRPGSTPSHL